MYLKMKWGVSTRFSVVINCIQCWVFRLVLYSASKVYTKVLRVKCSSNLHIPIITIHWVEKFTSLSRWRKISKNNLYACNMLKARYRSRTKSTRVIFCCIFSIILDISQIWFFFFSKIVSIVYINMCLIRGRGDN